MPIRHMASKLEDIPADAVNVRDVSASYVNEVHFSGGYARGEDGLMREVELTPEELAAKQAAWKLFSYDTHVGLCLFESEHNGYHDSDFYMTVWNPATQAPETIEFASTRGWCGPAFGSHPDATPEVVAAYEAWKAEQHRLDQLRRAEIRRHTPAFGKTVIVQRDVCGRKPETKLDKGMTGEIFWVQDIKYVWHKSDFEFTGRIGLRLADGTKRFTDAKNVRVIVA